MIMISMIITTIITSKDYSFEQPLHEQLELHLARKLRSGAIVASFSPWTHETGFALVATVEVETSWGDVPVEIRLKKECLEARPSQRLSTLLKESSK